MSEVEVIWRQCLEIIKQSVSVSNFETWFVPIKPVKIENTLLTIEVPSKYFVETIEGHYLDQLGNALRTVIGPNARLEYRAHVVNTPEGIVREETSMNRRNDVQLSGGFVSPTTNPFVVVGQRKLDIDPQLNKDYTFENYIVGSGNKQAYCVAEAVANRPGDNPFNPLYIYGNSGVGKTHLIQAIGAAVKASDSSKNVIYLSADRFMRQYMDARANNSINGFINFYQLIDVLIIDDIQEIAGKRGTESVFFQIFNHLQQNKKQIVIASDKRPVDIDGMEERLLNRFKSGLVVDVQMPDFDTRVRIVRDQISKDGTQLSDEVVDYIANNVSSSVRELKGSLVSMLALSMLSHEDITLEVARRVVSNLVKTSEIRELNIDTIIKVVCENYKIDESEIQKNTRKHEIVMARQVAMYLCKELTQTSLSTIGTRLGNRNHSTVLYSCKAVKDMIDTDKEFEKLVKRIEAQVKG